MEKEDFGVYEGRAWTLKDSGRRPGRRNLLCLKIRKRWMSIEARLCLSATFDATPKERKTENEGGGVLLFRFQGKEGDKRKLTTRSGGDPRMVLGLVQGSIK